ncbi:MAG: Kelch repeat-containing protein [Candidatus Dormibacteria bacterium]
MVTSTSTPAGPSPTATPARSPVLGASIASWHLPAPLSRMVVLADGSRLLIAGGLDSSGITLRTILAADPLSGQVSADGSLAVAVHDAAGAIVGGRAYVFGGGGSGSSRTVQALRPAAVAEIVGYLPTARADLAIASTGTVALVVGGFDGRSATRTVLASGDGVAFRALTDLPSALRYASVAAVGDALFVFGGESSGRAGATIYRVSIGSGMVDVVGVLPASLAHAAAAVMRGQVWLFGGISHGHATDQVLRFDPADGRVEAAGNLPLAISDAGIAVRNEVAYLVGGEGASGAQTSTVIELKVSFAGP